jgi:transposase
VAKRVHHYIKAFLAHRFDALPDRPHLGQQSSLTPAMEEAIRQELRQTERTCTAAQLADWVAERFDVRLTPDHLSRRLKRARIAYKRTGRSLKHKRKIEEAETKNAEMAAQEKRGTRARSMAPTRTRRGLPSRCRRPIAGIRWESGSGSRMRRRKASG